MGTTGIVYNPDEITKEEASRWALLADPQYRGQVTIIKDNVRDSYFAALGILFEDELMDPDFIRSGMNRLERIAELMNQTDDETVEKAEDILKEMKANAYSFESDSGKADMVTGKVLANYQWSGDAVYTLDQAEIVIIIWPMPCRRRAPTSGSTDGSCSKTGSREMPRSSRRPRRL